jgi:hypothetical protein|tara:strand:- start:557 stop:895 length:339 start_codon:yes stop_codon:yes gene_type:complete
MEKDDVVTIAKAIGQEIALALGPQKPESIVDPTDQQDGAFFDEESGEVIYTDMAVKAADEAEIKCFENMPQGTKAYKGKSGVMIINHSAETLEAIGNWKRSKRQYMTRSNVR